MKTALLLVASVLLLATPNTQAQNDEQPFPTGFGIGFQLSQVQKDFGVGINLTSPTFLNNRMAVRVRASMSFYEHPDSDGQITWTPYTSINAGLVGFSRPITENIRCYGEGGLIVLMPHEDFSSESTELGGYGLFGFEFFLTNGLSYVIELGGAGTGARADKIVGSPIYSNGFMIATGLRGKF